MTARDIVSLELFADDQVRRIKARLEAIGRGPQREVPILARRRNADRGPYSRREGNPNAPYHGSLSGYCRYHCHCDLCQGAWRDYRKHWYAKRKAQKGEVAHG